MALHATIIPESVVHKCAGAPFILDLAGNQTQTGGFVSPVDCVELPFQDSRDHKNSSGFQAGKYSVTLGEQKVRKQVGADDIETRRTPAWQLRQVGAAETNAITYTIGTSIGTGDFYALRVEVERANRCVAQLGGGESKNS